ncbi:MAG: SRPBCC family protein, partial [Chloroflexi bacterium]
YRFWRNFENLPRFMEHLKSVTVIDNKHSHWVARAPAGTSVEWDAEIINERENELIAWRSVGDATIGNAGSVHFTPAPGGRGTEVKVVLEYDPPAGRAGVIMARLFGEEPDQQVREDLRHFKEIMEAGEIPTTEGQPSGRSKK